MKQRGTKGNGVWGLRPQRGPGAEPLAFPRVNINAAGYKRAAALAIPLLILAAPAAADPAAVQGKWLTEDRGGVIDVRPCGDALCGIIVGVSEFPAGDVLRDVQGTPQCHLTLLRDLHPQDDGRWHGTVRNPEDGRIYDAEIWIDKDGALRLRGYVALELFGSTQIWPPFRGTIAPDCHFKGG